MSSNGFTIGYAPRPNREGVPTILVPTQQPLGTFHKDEGGRQNCLTFRFAIQGPIPLEAANDKGEIPVLVRGCYDTGEKMDLETEKATLEIQGGTEKRNCDPHVSSITGAGGVLYRFMTVSKRLKERKLCVEVSLVGCPHIAPLRSEGTMVYSKRKDADARKEEQAKEREVLESREREAVAKLQKLPPKRVRRTRSTASESAEAQSSVRATSLPQQQHQPPPSGSEALQERISSLESIVSCHAKILDEIRALISAQSGGPLPTMSRRVTSTAWFDQRQGGALDLQWQVSHPRNPSPVQTGLAIGPTGLHRDSSIGSSGSTTVASEAPPPEQLQRDVSISSEAYRTTSFGTEQLARMNSGYSLPSVFAQSMLRPAS